jgi:uncharacterized delta-60 repeat protein
VILRRGLSAIFVSLNQLKSNFMMRICSIALVFLNVLLSLNLHAQGSLMWSSGYAGSGDNSDRFNKIVPDDNSGTLVAVGYELREGNYRDFLTVKMDANGDTLWKRTYNGFASLDDEAVAVAVDVLGNVFVTGYADWDHQQDNILLLKYDSAGNLLWASNWNGSSFLDDMPTAIVTDPSGDVIITGYTEPDTVTGSQDYITLKFASSNGALQWQAQYSRPGVTSGKDEAFGLAVDTSGDVYITGRSSNGTDDDIVTIKYNGLTGIPAWTVIYNSGNGDDRGTALVLDNAGNVLVTGRNDNGNNDDIRTIKYNASGVLQWSKFYNGPANQNDRGLAIAVDASNNVYVTGQSDVDNSAVTDYDIVTLKYNASGVAQWSRVEAGNALQNDIPSAMVVDAAGNVIVTGKSDQDPNTLVNDNSYITVLYNTAGVKQWSMLYAGTRAGGSDIASSVCIGGSFIYVAGGSENTVTQKDGTVVKYDYSGNEVWVKAYNGKGDFSESARAIVVDANNRTYAAGYTFHEDDKRDILLVSFDANGDTLCRYRFNGSNDDDDELNSVGIDASGYVYAAGYTKSIDQKSNFFTMKWDPATCDTVWTRQYNGASNQTDRIEDMVVDAAGFVYVTGRSDSDPNDTLDNNNIVTIKYDANGNQLWLQSYNGAGNLRDEPSRIIFDNAGNILVTGRAENIQNDDFIVLKYDPSTGNPVWSNPAIYNGPFANDDRALDITVNSLNEIFVAGYSQTGQGASPDDAAIVKFDVNGNFAGFFGYDGLGTGNDQVVAITHDLSDNIIATFLTDVDPDPMVSNYNILTIKFDGNLNQVWTSPPEYNSPINGDDVPIDLVVNSSGDVFVIGASEADTIAARVNRNWVIIRYSPSGTQSWVTTVDGTGADDDEPNTLAIRGTSLWVAGYTVSAGTQKDLTVNRYDISTNVTFPDRRELAIQAFPNPMTETATLDFGQPLPDGSSLEVTDLTGKLLQRTAVNGSRIALQRLGWEAGLYLVSVVTPQGDRYIARLIVQ